MRGSDGDITKLATSLGALVTVDHCSGRVYGGGCGVAAGEAVPGAEDVGVACGNVCATGSAGADEPHAASSSALVSITTPTADRIRAPAKATPPVPRIVRPLRRIAHRPTALILPIIAHACVPAMVIAHTLTNPGAEDSLTRGRRGAPKDAASPPRPRVCAIV